MTFIPSYNQLLQEYTERRKHWQREDKNNGKILSTIWSLLVFGFVSYLFALLMLFAAVGYDKMGNATYFGPHMLIAVNFIFNYGGTIVLGYIIWHFIYRILTIWDDELTAIVIGAKKSLKEKNL
jgi:hypothetical protein